MIWECSFYSGNRNCAILMFSPGYYKRLGDLDHRSGIQPTSQRYGVQRILSAMQQLGDRFRPFSAVHCKKWRVKIILLHITTYYYRITSTLLPDYYHITIIILPYYYTITTYYYLITSQLLPNTTWLLHNYYIITTILLPHYYILLPHYYTLLLYYYLIITILLPYFYHITT